LADTGSVRASNRDVVLKVNGTLHQVPWSKLPFGNTTENSDDPVILPGMSQDAFNSCLSSNYFAGGRG
jgi:hypothetical protein